ncbi:GNAT family N-acetyltransferase [Heyndrickxia oleronia]|uniref:GNAT family N-acetyltransferase n=1 Tax=Heyndrickxia oleronia TaxID=38875 RepID=UPI00203E4B38|nr:GNAT family N-acetyltransferase [Heyndrickxia oleronia]MCM3240205.1 GNAT family N-acetyltransferase [Heyndrickxia oleronia]
MLEIRKGTVEDLSIIRQLGIDTYYAHFKDNWENKKDINKFLEKDFSKESLEKSLKMHNIAWLIAYIENEAIGFAKVNFDRKLPNNQTRGAELQKIYFLPSATGKGYGDILLNEVIKLSIQNNQGLLWLEVLKTNHQAKAFYEKKGFNVKTETILKGLNGDMSLWVMIKDLQMTD